MFSIGDLLSKAWKNVVEKAYWKSFGFCVLMYLATIAVSVINNLVAGGSVTMMRTPGQMVFGMLMSYALVIVVKEFVLNNLLIGSNKYFLDGAKSDKFEFSAIVHGFSEGRYMKYVKTLFFRDLYLFLWFMSFYVLMIAFTFLGTKNPAMLILMIPIYIGTYIFLIGIYYGYSFVPYILLENQEMTTKEVISLSKSMAKYRKFKMFLLDLAVWGVVFIVDVFIMFAVVKNAMMSFDIVLMFFGYFLMVALSALVVPYYLGVKAQLYLAIKSRMNGQPNDVSEELEASSNY